MLAFANVCIYLDTMLSQWLVDKHEWVNTINKYHPDLLLIPLKLSLRWNKYRFSRRDCSNDPYKRVIEELLSLAKRRSPRAYLYKTNITLHLLQPLCRLKGDVFEWVRFALCAATGPVAPVIMQIRLQFAAGGWHPRRARGVTVQTLRAGRGRGMRDRPPRGVQFPTAVGKRILSWDWTQLGVENAFSVLDRLGSVQDKYWPLSCRGCKTI